MAKVRDSQRIKIYRSSWAVKEDRQELTWREVNQYVNKIAKSSAIKKLGLQPLTQLRVFKKHHGNATYAYWNDSINLPKWAWNKHTIIHELAHAMVYRDKMPRGKGIAAHGPRFVKWELWLAAKFVSKEYAKQLQALYAKQGVKVEGKTGKISKVRMPAGMEEYAESKFPSNIVAIDTVEELIAELSGESITIVMEEME